MAKRERARALLTKTRVRVLLLICVLVTAGLIFFFSAQDGATSTETSDGFVRMLVKLFIPKYDEMTWSQRRKLWNDIGYYVRKGAHFTEYAALGFFLRLLARSLNLRRAGLIAWACGALYAVTDEFHQTFTAARSGMWQDVVLDSAGVLFGCLAALAVIPLILRRRRRKMK